MSFDSDFLGLMPHSVVVYARSGSNNYGEATFSTVGSTYRARVGMKPIIARTAMGETIEPIVVAWVASTGTIRTTDRVVLPDGTSPTVAMVERMPDEDGTYINKLIFQHDRQAG